MTCWNKYTSFCHRHCPLARNLFEYKTTPDTFCLQILIFKQLMLDSLDHFGRFGIQNE
ncbi:Uncharacterized protein APZ42_031151 [Daphnia magna]|uniref:Uncharacterized protein n=1 Tax=Daphnia magna TaxID=35525 RepID=A0A162DC54_9CRUS|nr:Uncharacterized protein APZ42_031151 [Daphnia magna]